MSEAFGISPRYDSTRLKPVFTGRGHPLLATATSLSFSRCSANSPASSASSSMSIPKARRQGILRALPFILAAMRIVHRVHSGRDVARITELAGNISRMPPALTYRADCKYDRGRLAAIPDVCHREHQVLSTLLQNCRRVL